MPITMIFFPGRMPPRMRPLKGTVYAKYVKVISLERRKKTVRAYLLKKTKLRVCIFHTRRRDKSSLSGEMRPGFPSESFRWSSSTFFNTSDKRRDADCQLAHQAGQKSARPRLKPQHEASSLKKHTQTHTVWPCMRLSLTMTRWQQTCHAVIWFPVVLHVRLANKLAG